jgi:hypothetical protein
MAAPNLETAVPKRRYQFGGFVAVVLGDIQSAGDEQYRYVLAMIPEGESDPTLYVAAVADPAGGYRLRLTARALEKELPAEERWGDLDVFANDALAFSAQVLGLTDERPFRLM